MVTEIKNNTITDWNKKITLQLTLKDLQFIFDAIGDLTICTLKEKHKENSPFYSIISVNDIALIRLIDNLYDELRIIIDKYNGVLDD